MNKYVGILAGGILLWISSTAYFGYNETAQSPAESFTDTISTLLIFWGLLGDILTNLKITKNYYYKIYKSKSTNQ